MTIPKLWFGIKAVILKDDKILVLKRSEEASDNWEIPGGRMEYGETIEETLHREVYEETRLKVKALRILNTWNLIEVDRQISGIIYLCCYESGEVILSDEHKEYRWIEESEIRRLYKVFSDSLRGFSFNDKYNP